MKHITFRNCSLALGILASAAVIYLMYQHWLFEQWAREQAAHGYFICGMSVLGVVIGAGVALIVAATGSVLGLISYWHISRPRPRQRLLEPLLIVAFPLFCIFVGLYRW